MAEENLESHCFVIKACISEDWRYTPLFFGYKIAREPLFKL